MQKGDGFTHGNTKPTPQPKEGAWFSGHVASDLLQSYSSKMMKAIWGEYNRYSVHNFKSNQALPGELVAQPQELPGAERGADSVSAGGLLTH